MLNIPAEYDRDTSSAKFKDFFANSFLRYLVPPLQPESCDGLSRNDYNSDGDTQ
jgi:hypothetical protein